MAGLAAVAKPLVSILLTDKWLPCVPYMQVYCFSFAFYPVHSCNLQAINAMGRSDIFLKLEIIKKTYGILVLAIAVFCFDSPLAIALTGLITTWIGWFVNSSPNKKLINYSYKEQIIDLVPSMIMSLIMCIVVLLVGKIKVNLWILLPLQIVIGAGVYYLMSLIFMPGPYKLLIDQLKKVLNSRSSNNE